METSYSSNTQNRNIHHVYKLKNRPACFYFHGFSVTQEKNPTDDENVKHSIPHIQIWQLMKICRVWCKNMMKSEFISNNVHTHNKKSS